jgi:hypothetical protein
MPAKAKNLPIDGALADVEDPQNFKHKFDSAFGKSRP